MVELKDTEKAAVLFEGWQETIIWSCLQGVMGKIYVDSQKEPSSAMAVLGDFGFVAGRPDQELLVYEQKRSKRNFRILVPGDQSWAEQIERYYGENAKRVIRYAIKKEPKVFRRDMLQRAVEDLPKEYTMEMIDEKWFWHCREIPWCKDWVAQYDDYKMYQKYGLGAVILKDGEPVSGASSYSGYRDGIEIEIDTREDYRRRGLAFRCGAKLILACLERGWYPSWDAQNLWSVALAEKLGYHLDHAYGAYEVVR